MERKAKSSYVKKGLIIASVPAGVVAAALIPLQPLLHQALVGVVLVWLYVAVIFL